jgi:hypothetical protein
MPDPAMHWRESRLQMEREIYEEMLKQRRLGTNSWSVWKIRDYARETATERCREAVARHNVSADERKRRRGEAI